MKIEEVFIEGKYGDPSRCEDGYVITENFIACIDGATSLNDKIYDGMKTGLYAMKLVSDAIQNLPAEADCEEAIDHITNAIRNEYIKLGILELMEKNPFQRFTAGAIIYSRHHRQIWQIGDCQALIDNIHYEAEHAVDHYPYGMRSFVLQEMLYTGKITQEEILSNDPTWQGVIYPKVLLQYNFQNAHENSFWSYSAFDGTKIPMSKVIILDVSQAKEIVLATDGYPVLRNGTLILKTTLKESEQALAEINHRDPMCIYENIQGKCNQPGNKSFDDRTYIRFTL